MILDKKIKDQLIEYLKLMEGNVVIKLSTGSDETSSNMLGLADELASISTKIQLEKATLPRTPSFSINRVGEETGITFAGIPLGHEFTSLVLALLQVSGRPPKVEEKIIKAIKNLKGIYNFESYISLTCHNCPEVVQALNLMALLNPNITHTMIEGGLFKSEIESKNIMAVPTVYLMVNCLESDVCQLKKFLRK